MAESGVKAKGAKGFLEIKRDAVQYQAKGLCGLCFLADRFMIASLYNAAMNLLEKLWGMTAGDSGFRRQHSAPSVRLVNRIWELTAAESTLRLLVVDTYAWRTLMGVEVPADLHFPSSFWLAVVNRMAAMSKENQKAKRIPTFESCFTQVRNRKHQISEDNYDGPKARAE